MYGSYKGQEIYYKNKSNSGAIGTDLYYQIPDDKTLYQLSKFDLQEKTEDYLEWGNNNWVEFFYGDTGASDVADEDNVLEAVGEVLEFIEEFYQTYLDVGGESREQPQNDSDKHPVAIGAIEYFDAGGNVSKRVEYTDETKFRNQIKDDNPCDGCSCSQNECAYRSSVPKYNDDDLDDEPKKTFRFTYSVERYVEIEVSAANEDEARKLALQKSSEINCGDLQNVDWNEIECEED